MEMTSAEAIEELIQAWNDTRAKLKSMGFSDPEEIDRLTGKIISQSLGLEAA